MKFSADGDYVPVRLIDRSTALQEYDLSWYEANQPVSDPIFFVADNSIFIYPAPKEAVEDGIKFYGIKGLANVIASTDENLLFGGKIPTKYHYLISEGMTQFIKRTQGKDQEGEAAKQIFENETLPKLANKLGNRKVGVSKRGTPDVSKYK